MSVVLLDVRIGGHLRAHNVQKGEDYNLLDSSGNCISPVGLEDRFIFMEEQDVPRLNGIVPFQDR